MSDQSTSFFSQLSQKDLLRVLKKLRLREYVRVSRTCKWLNSLSRDLFSTHSEDSLIIGIETTQNTLEFVLKKKWDTTRIYPDYVEDLRGIYFPCITFNIPNDHVDVFEASFRECPQFYCELLYLNIGAGTERLFTIVKTKCTFKYIKVDKCTASFVSLLPQKSKAFVTQLMTALLPDYSILTRFEYARIHKYSQSITNDANLGAFLKKLVREGPGQLRQLRLPNVSKRVDLQYLQLDLIHLYDLDFDAFDNGRPVIEKCSFLYLEIALNRVLFITVMRSDLECQVINNDLLTILETLLERLQLFTFKRCTLKYSPYDLGSFFDELSVCDKADYDIVVTKFLEFYRTHWDIPRK